MLVDSSAADIVYTPYFTGVHGNYLKPSIVASGLDPDDLPHADKTSMNFGSNRVKPWKDVWGAGQGVGSIDRIQPTREIVAQLKQEFHQARSSVLAQEWNV